MPKLSAHRLVFSGKPIGLPGLLSFGYDVFRNAGELETHGHNGYELCYLLSGRVRWRFGSDLQDVAGRDATVLPPDFIHGGLDGVMHPCKLFWLILDRSLDGLALSGAEQADCRSVWSAPAKTTVSSDDLEWALIRTRDALKSGGDP